MYSLGIYLCLGWLFPTIYIGLGCQRSLIHRQTTHSYSKKVLRVMLSLEPVTSSMYNALAKGALSIPRPHLYNLVWCEAVSVKVD
jgi:hypothetical protein